MNYLSDLHPKERRIIYKAFCRYHAALQVDNDCRVVLLGAAIYAIALRPILATPPPTGGIWIALKTVSLGLATLWPTVLRRFHYNLLLDWRDVFFTLHWYLHHVVGPRMLVQAGVDLRPNLSSPDPRLFFLGFWFSRPGMWFCGNMLVYRMKFPLFAVVQPILLLMAWLNDQEACKASAAEHPENTKRAFGGIASFLRSITHSSPVYLDAQRTPFEECCKVHAFLLFLIALILPGLVIWYLEQHTWRDFIKANPEVLTWPGGPAAPEINRIQKRMQRARKNEENYFIYAGVDGRLVGISLVLAITLWQLLDATPAMHYMNQITIMIGKIL